MVKGVAIKFKSYKETIPSILNTIKLEAELKKYNTIILKPFAQTSSLSSTPSEFLEAVLEYCVKHKTPESKIFIAEGSDGEDTLEVFDLLGYRQLAEKYEVGLLDLNNAEVEELQNGEFLKFDKIMYPKILMESFIISLPKLSLHDELELQGSLSSMIGAFPSQHYKGFFSRRKSKIRNWPMKYSVHDILKCKMPQLAVSDASEKGFILAGQPMEIDKQMAKLAGKDWRSIGYLRLADESFSPKVKKDII